MKKNKKERIKKFNTKIKNKNKIKNSIFISTIVLVLTFILFIPLDVHARHGDSGYEGGISSGIIEGKTTLDYKEVSFITGKPVELEGTLTIRKSSRNDTITTTYTYNLQN
jgi:N-acetylmuramoyl-L-alanine amidase